MIKYVIKRDNVDAVFIFHALPEEIQNITKFRWCIAEDINLLGTPIQSQEFESYTFTTDQIKENGYSGKYLYCEYDNKTTSGPVKTEYIRLYPDVNKMVNAGVIFDDIANFDKNGDIVSDKL